LKRLLACICLAALNACQDESAEKPQPVTMTATSVGHFCQMDMLEHPGPKAQIHLVGLPGMPLFFSQVRDAIAYLRMPEQSHDVAAIYVSDMGEAVSWQVPGPDNWIAAETAHYVLGSNRAGGMGAPELVPFAGADAARGFIDRYGGHVVALDEIPDEAVLAPVQKPGAVGRDDDDLSERLRALSKERTN